APRRRPARGAPRSGSGAGGMSTPEPSGDPAPGGTPAGTAGRGRRRWAAAAPVQAPAADPRVLEEIRRRAMDTAGGLTELDLASAVRTSGSVMGAASSTEMLRSLSDDIHGLGVLERLAQVPGTTDI